MDKIQEIFLQNCSDLGIPIAAEQIDQLERYFHFLIDWNEKVNLTAITDREAVYTKHFFDSLLLAKAEGFRPDSALLDVGAGAGFPSMPVKICFPSLPVSILDSLNKRILFLNELASLLRLSSCSFYHGRAEEAGRTPVHREAYPQVTARAVAKLSVLSELCLPFVKKDGFFFALKGPDAQDELKDASGAIQKLGGVVEHVQTFTLPGNEGTRSLVVIRKVGHTPKAYPRKPGTPARSPLQ